MITEEQYRKACDDIEASQAVQQEYHKQREEAFQSRLKSGVPFTDDELIYSARDLCPCGHGVAYPRGCGPSHYWDCAGILKGVADPGAKHCGRMPFAFYEIKSENQPSAYGSTTRGVFSPKPDTT